MFVSGVRCVLCLSVFQRAQNLAEWILKESPDNDDKYQKLHKLEQCCSKEAGQRRAYVSFCFE
jgi:hypothetical protein